MLARRPVERNFGPGLFARPSKKSKVGILAKERGCNPERNANLKSFCHAKFEKYITHTENNKHL